MRKSDEKVICRDCSTTTAEGFYSIEIGDEGLNGNQQIIGWLCRDCQDIVEDKERESGVEDTDQQKVTKQKRFNNETN